MIRPGGVPDCWTYHVQTVSPEVDVVVRMLYADVLGPFWSKQICTCGSAGSAVVELGHRSRPRAILTYFSSRSIPK